MALATSQNRQIPVGYVFLPTDLQLVAHFLPNFILHQTCECNDIEQLNIYSSDPTTLLCGRQDAYYITPRKRMHENSSSSKVDRKAGNGSWKKYGQDEEIYSDDGQVVGVKRAMFYRFNDEKKNSGWTMYEYELSGEQVNGNETKFQEFVICRIKMSPQAMVSSGQKRKRGEVSSSSGPVISTSGLSAWDSPAGTPRSAESNFRELEAPIIGQGSVSPFLNYEGSNSRWGGREPFVPALNEGASEDWEILFDDLFW